MARRLIKWACGHETYSTLPNYMLEDSKAKRYGELFDCEKCRIDKWKKLARIPVDGKA